MLSRGWCHLCDDMRAALALLGAGAVFDLDIVDVDAFPDLEQRYGEDVPVLMAGEQELCRHRLNPAALAVYLASQSSFQGDSSHGFAAPQGQIG